jgi:hypothetical protein
MSERTLAIAAIPLARAPLRLLLAPLILLLAAAVAAAGGILVAGAVGVALIGAGGVVAALGLYLAVMLLSIRLDVEVATLRVRWLGGGRRYMLSRGAVTRVLLRGEGAARLRPRFGALGWAFGRASLRDEERIEVIRLARTDSVILVPTDRGRLAIAPALESQLIDALMAAARVQQRLDEVAMRAWAFGVPGPATAVDGADAADAADAEQPAPLLADAEQPHAATGEPLPEPPMRVLTGIERTLLEERLAAERAVALAAAEAERRAAEEAATLASAPPAEVVAPADEPVEEPRRRRFALRLPALRRRVSEQQVAATVAEAVALPAQAAPGAATDFEPMVGGEAVEATRPASPSAERARAAFSLLVRTAAVSVPLVAAAAVAGVALLTGQLALPEAQLRPAVLALALAGPLGALAALVARAWFPRLAWLVAVTSLLVLVMVGRALLA